MKKDDKTPACKKQHLGPMRYGQYDLGQVSEMTEIKKQLFQSDEQKYLTLSFHKNDNFRKN